MKILIDIGHPGHVHLLRNFYHDMIKREHKVWVTTRNIPIIKQLLEYYNIPYINLGEKKDSLIGKGLSQLQYNWQLYKIAKKHKIQIGIGTSITLAHISRFLNMKSIILDDDDDDVQPLFVKYAHPYSDTILSPEALKGHRKSAKTVFYKGFHELAYLHPKRFKPDKQVLRDAGVKDGERFFIMRFNVFKAHHDVGINGLSLNQKLELINLLKPFGKIFITTERNIEPELKPYQLPVSPEKIHSLIFYATMFLGDSQTMTSEAAVLGTPAIKCNSFAGKLSVPNKLEKVYGLCFSFQPTDFKFFFNRIGELLETYNIKELWKTKKEQLLKDNIDVTAFLVWFVENYPNSLDVMKENPDYQNRFK